MPAHALPTHPVTGLRAIFVSERTGRIFWPILGGEESADAAAQAAAKAAADAAAQADMDAKAAGDKGFPENTPLEQMKPEQRESYWKHQARKHEDRVKAFGGVTPERLAELQDKANKHDALELELGTTADKAAAKAAEDARTEERTKTQPALISARLDAAAARAGVSDEDLTKAIEFVDTTKFVNAAGDIDTDKVKAFIATITPAKGTAPARPGPTPTGQGQHGRPSAPGASTVSAGRDLFAQMHPKKS